MRPLARLPSSATGGGRLTPRTGGLASSYAGAAAQGSYDSYMQQLAAKVPELYQLAYSMYQNDADRELSNLNMLRGLQSDERSQYNTDRAYNYGVYSDNRDFTAREAQQTKENEWTQQQIDRGINENALQAAMSNGLSQAQWGARRPPPVAEKGSRASGRDLDFWTERSEGTKSLSRNRIAQKEQYRRTGKGGAAVANYETYQDYMTGLTNYYAAQLK